jgi:type III secretion protein V
VQIDDTLSAPWFRCEWNDLCLPAQRGLSAESLLVNDTTARLALLNIKGERAVNPANGAEGAIIDKSFDAVANRAGLTTWDARGYAVLATAAMIRGAAGALVNRPLYELYNLRLREMSPDLISLVEETMDADFLVQILRGLLSEEIGVRDLSTIVEAALELRATISADTNQYIVFPPATGGIFVDPSRRSPVALSPLDYVEFVRTRLKRQISHKYTRGGNTLVVYLMDRGCEDLLARSEHVDPAFEAAITKSIHEEVGALPPAAQQPVILTAMNVRRRLRRVVSAEFPQLAVVSYQELSPDMNIQPIGRITVELPRPSP